MHSIKAFLIRGIGILTILAVAIIPFAQRKSATQAGSISSVSVVASDTSISTAANYTITFTPATASSNPGNINLGFQAPPDSQFSIGNVALSAGTSAVLTGIGFKDTQYGSISINASSIPAQELTIKLSGIVNPSKAGKYSVWIETRSGFSQLDNGSASFTIGTLGISGTVSLPNGGAGAKYVWVEAQEKGDFSKRFGSSTDANGAYGIGGLTSGKTYIVQVFVNGGPDSNTQGYSSPEPVEKTYSGSVITQNFTLAQATKTVSGTITRANGQAVANARVNGMRMDGPGFANAQANSSGQYTLTMTGGKYEIRPDTFAGPGQEAPDYSFSGPGTQIQFAKDSTTETKTNVNFAVITANSTITGAVNPIPSGGFAGVGIHNRSGFGTGTGINPSTGTFSARVPAGTYEIDMFSDMQSSGDRYAFPSMNPVSVGESETKNLGTINLVKMDKTINATVRDGTSLQGLPNMQIGCFKPKGGGYTGGRTDANGIAPIKVTEGEWGCMANAGMGGPKDGGGGPGAFLQYLKFVQKATAAEPPQEQMYVIMGGPKFVTVSGATSPSITFNAVIADKTITVLVTDSNGAALQEYGFIEAQPAGDTNDDFGKGGGLGSPIDPNMPGMASIKVPAGIYDLRMMTPPGSDYSSGDPARVNVTTGNASANIVLLRNDSTISGTLKDEDGKTVTGIMAFVSATNAKGGFIPGDVSSNNGNYSMRVPSAGGALNLGYFVDPASGYFPQPFTDATVTPVANATITKDIVMKKATATVNFTVKDPSGNPVANAFVEADNRKAVKGLKMDNFFSHGDMTDANGKITLKFPADTFKFQAFLPPQTLRNNKWMPPKTEEVVLVKNSTTNITITFQAADVVLSGKVAKTDGTAVSEAFITAYSKDGESIEIPTDTNGNYTVNVTSGEWHIVAEKDETSTSSAQVTPLLSVDTAIDTSASKTITQNLTVSAGAVLSTPVSSTYDSDNSKMVRLTDGALSGAVVSIPQDALDSDGQGDNVTLSVQSTVEIPRQLLNKPLGNAGVDIIASSSQGQPIISTASSVAITIPVLRQDVENAGLAITDFGTLATMSYYDEENGKWAPLDGSVTAVGYDANGDGDTTDGTDKILVTGQSSHFTTFAVTASTDTIPPSAPTGISATAGAQKITLAWTNPTESDLAGIKIYRSTTSGTVGDLVTTIANTTTTSYQNTGLTANTTYYYVVKSYDGAGNISTNITQVNAKTNAALPATGAASGQSVSMWWLLALAFLPIIQIARTKKV
ncbi:MAG: glycoside hydrolase [Candidatus Berkelbacteria bacterium Licking1014_7]|uniref:Glycoside hydrolase n=1 Tax=Candidatus Berkelbacteria bacterium Licking1014_7 TaxID=2017147 RepID=A0A554LI98_9BACT|nr:MAG: glycoside hydrolase [Candidatus Berkelbacteria bacterium Licking1014_7]